MAWVNLIRTIMVLTQSWAYNVALTPPNPPPPKTEQKKHTDTMPLSVTWMARIWKVCAGSRVRDTKVVMLTLDVVPLL